jgi:hypothetical protein
MRSVSPRASTVSHQSKDILRRPSQSPEGRFSVTPPRRRGHDQPNQRTHGDILTFEDRSLDSITTPVPLAPAEPRRPRPSRAFCPT